MPSRLAGRQTCKSCGWPDFFNFHVPDYVWAQVVPPRLRNLVVCLACFDGFACEADLDYARYIQVLHFAGDRAAVVFEARSAADVYVDPTHTEGSLWGAFIAGYAAAEARVAALEAGLRQIINIIGPSVPDATLTGAAEGMQAEIAAALDVAGALLDART